MAVGLIGRQLHELPQTAVLRKSFDIGATCCSIPDADQEKDRKTMLNQIARIRPILRGLHRLALCRIRGAAVVEHQERRLRALVVVVDHDLDGWRTIRS
jgi:hypothetical protein